MTLHRTGKSLVLLVLSLCAAAALPAGPCRADDYLDRVNAQFKSIPEEKRSDLKVLPLLADMTDPPAVLGSQKHAALLGFSGPGWAECKAWAQAAPQKALIDVLPTITSDQDTQKGFAFGQPYGVEGVPLDLIKKGMYTDLDDPPLLSWARHLYMPAMERFGVLVQVEASRLAEAGDASAAIDLMIRWLYFCRQMADRPFLAEKEWAMDSISLAIMRIRDLAYGDFRAEKHSLDAAKVVDIIKKLKNKGGVIAIDRIRPPEANFVGKEQLIHEIMVPTGGPNPDNFATTMARITSLERPLRLFSSAAYWEQIRGSHAGTLETQKLLAQIHDDWYQRWDLSYFDPVLHNKTDYQLKVAGKAKFAVLQAKVSDIEGLFETRQIMKVELAGTRAGLGVYGYFLRQGAQPQYLPPSLDALRPDFTDHGPVEVDPYSSKKWDIQYFLISRDEPRGPNGEIRQHRIKLFPPEPEPRFDVPLGSDQFILYSVGPDDDKGSAVSATQARRGVGGDYLLWPPALSLYRKRLIETDALK